MGNQISNNKNGDQSSKSNMEPDMQDKNQSDEVRKERPRRRRAGLRSWENRPKKRKNKKMNK